MRTLLIGLALSVPLAITGVAQAAPIAECGGIDFEAQGFNCEVKTSGGCTAECTPINVDAQCDVNIRAPSCTASCMGSADVNCTASCNTSCTASCMANASFDCNADCNASCTGDCMGQCASNLTQSQCAASCQGTCRGHCSASCMASGSADCMAKCSGSCSGSCTAKANFSCEGMCTPGSAYAQCETMVTGGCQAQCSQPKGALFCNGQYVDTSKFSLDTCLQKLLSQYNIKASGYAYGSCMNGQCSGMAGGDVSCATKAPGAGDYAFGSLAAFGALGFGLAFMRRRQTKKAQA